MPFKDTVETVGWIIDLAGVAILAIAVVLGTARFLLHFRDQRAGKAYERFRGDLGRGILLGLEFLVAADIIRTVAVEPTMQNVLVLGVIVLIRTFLSFALEIELEGRLPWHAADERGQRRGLG